jgi:hypothetical protein
MGRVKQPDNEYRPVSTPGGLIEDVMGGTSQTNQVA